MCFFRLVSKTVFTRNNTRHNNFIFLLFNWWGKKRLNVLSFIVLSQLKILFFQRLFLSVLMLLLFFVISFPFWWFLFWVAVLVWFMSEGGSFAVVEDGVFSNICSGCPWNVLLDDWIFTFSFAINLSQLSVSALARIWKRFGDLSESFLFSDQFRCFFLFDMVKTLMISLLL